jgi:hypothetical protein
LAAKLWNFIFVDFLVSLSAVLSFDGFPFVVVNDHQVVNSCKKRAIERQHFLFSYRTTGQLVGEKINSVAGPIQTTGPIQHTSRKTCMSGCPLRLGGDSGATVRAFLVVQNDVYTTGVMMLSQKLQRNSLSPFSAAQFTSVNYFSSGFIFFL